MPQSEYELIKKVLEDDRSSFEQLIVNYEKLVYSICFRFMKNPEDAEDMSQEVFIILYKNLQKFSFKSSLSTWIYRICVNTCLTRLKSLNKEKCDQLTDQEITYKNYDPSTLIEITAEKDFMLAELNKLNEKSRLIAKLRLISDKSFVEIANILHLFVSNTRTNFKRTKDYLKGRIESYRKE